MQIIHIYIRIAPSEVQETMRGTHEVGLLMSWGMEPLIVGFLRAESGLRQLQRRGLGQEPLSKHFGVYSFMCM